MDGNQRVPAATLTAYAEARAALQAALSADDYRYLSFQLWQEGVARYVEYRAAAIAAREYTPSPGFRALPDYADYGATAERLRRTRVARSSGAITSRPSRRVAAPPAPPP